MAGIRLPDLVQKIKIDTKDMDLAAQRATAFGAAMRNMSRDSDTSTDRISRSFADMDTATRRNRDSLTDSARSMVALRNETDKVDFMRPSRQMNQWTDTNRRFGNETDTTTRKLSLMQRALEKFSKTSFGSKVMEDMKEREGITLDVNANFVRAQRDLDMFAARVDRTELNVDVDADTTGAASKIRTVTDKAYETTIKAEVDAENLENFTKRLNASRDRKMTIEADADTLKAEAQLKFAARDRYAQIKVDMDKTLTSRVFTLTQAFTSLFHITSMMGMSNFLGFGFWAKFAMPAGIIGGIQALIPLLGSLGTELVQLSAIGLALPAGLGMIGASAGVLVGVFKGLSDATDKQSVSFKNFVALAANSFSQLRNSMRADVLGGLGSAIQNLAARALPALNSNLRATSTAWGGVLRSVVNFGAQQSTLNSVNRIVAGGVPIVRDFGKILINAASGFLQIGVAGIPVMQRLSAATVDLSAKFRVWVNQAVQSGKMTEWMNTAIEKFKQLGRIISDLGHALGSMSSIADRAGSGFLDTLEAISEGLRTIMDNPFVQDGLAKAFSGVSDLVKSVLGDFDSLGSIIGTLGRITGEVFSSLGAVMREVMPALAQGFANLGPGLSQLVQMIGPFVDVIKAIAPAFIEVTAAAGPFIVKLSEFVTTAVRDLSPLFREMANAIGDILITAMKAAEPVLADFARGFSQIGPVLAEFVKVIGPAIAGAVQFALKVADLMGPFLTYPLILGGVVVALHKVVVVFTALKAVLASTFLVRVITEMFGLGTASTAAAAGLTAAGTAGGVAATGVGAAGTAAGVAAGRFAVLGTVLKGIVIGGALVAGIALLLNQFTKLDDLKLDPGKFESYSAGLKEVQTQLKATADNGIPLGDNLSDLKGIFDATFAPSTWQEVDNTAASFNKLFGFKNTSDIAVATQRMGEFDKAMADMVKAGNREGAKQLFDILNTEAIKAGYTTEALKAKLPQYAAAQHDAAVSTTHTAVAISEATKNSAGWIAGLLGIASKSNEAKSATDALAFSLKGINEGVLAARSSQNAWGETIDKSKTIYSDYLTQLKEDAKEKKLSKAATDAYIKSHMSYTEALGWQTAAGRKNREAIDSVVVGTGKYMEYLRSINAPASAFRDAINQTTESLVKQVRPFFKTEAQARAYVAQLLKIPADIQSKLALEDAEAKKKAEDAKKRAKELNGTVATTKLDADDKPLVGKTAQATKNIQAFAELRGTAKVDVDTGPMDSDLDGAKASLAAINGTTASPTLDANTAPMDSDLEGAKASMAAINATTATPTVDADTGPMVSDLDTAKASMREIDGATATAKVSADTGPMVSDLDEAKRSMREIDGTTAVASIDLDRVKMVAQMVLATADMTVWSMTTATAKLDVTTGPAAEKLTALKNLLVTFQSASYSTVVTVNTTQAIIAVTGLNIALAAIPRITMVSVIANTALAIGAVAALRAIMAAWAAGKYMATLQANPAPAAGIVSVLTALMLAWAVRLYRATLQANSAPAVAAVVLATGALARFASITATARATVSVNWAAINSAEYALDRLARTRTATISVRIVGGSANGNLFPPTKSFAAGGLEQHYAQIASGGMWRLWAEPETGGEAYIPLSPGKRKRSREIWRQTGMFLGFDPEMLKMLTRMDQGGLLGSRVAQVEAAQSRMMPYYTPAAQAGRGAKADEPEQRQVHYHFNFEVHNPLPESSSETAVKQMTRLGTLGVFGG